MQVAEQDAVLGPIVLLGCVAAAVAVTGILFVLYGPVPVRRSVTMVSRIQPSLPMAAMPVMFEYKAPPEPVAVAVEPPPIPARKVKPKAEGPVAPLQLRRPRESPPPLPRSRAARGTQHRGFEPEMTMPEAPPFEVDDPTFRDAR